MKTHVTTFGWRFAVALAIGFGASLPAWAQNPKLDLDNLTKLADRADQVVDVTLDGATLKFAEKFMEADKDEDDEEALNIIRNLSGIYVKSFEFDKPGEYSDADVAAIRAQLRGGAWSRLVEVTSRHDHELDEVYVMSNPNTKTNLGLAIISAEPQELTVVNIVGPIDVNELGALEGKMGVPNLDLKPGDRGGRHDAH